MYTGLRRSDAAIFGRQHIRMLTNPETGVREKWIRIVPKKTGKSSAVIVEMPLLTELESVLATASNDHLTFLTTD